MLRDPLSRLISLYNYGLSTPAVSWRARMLQEKPTIVDFAKGHYTNTADNGITRFLSGHSLSHVSYGHCGHDTVNQAITNLKAHFCAVGFLEEFDQSLLLFKHVLAWQKQPLYKRRNVTPQRSNQNPKLLQASDLTDADLVQLEDYIKRDRIVCQAAKKLYLNRLQQIPQFEDKLQRFRAENDKFQKKKSLIGYLKAKGYWPLELPIWKKE